MNALLLLTEVHGRGGIQRFNLTLLDALGAAGVRRTVVSLVDGAAAEPAAPVVSEAFDGAGKSRVRFAWQALRALWRRPVDVLLVGHVHFLVMAAVLRWLSPRPRTPLVLVAHGLEVWEGVTGLRRWALERCAMVLCVSRYTAQCLQAQAPRMSPDRFVTFPNALHEDWTRRVALPGDASPVPGRYLLAVSRLEPGERQKGIITTLEAFAAVDAPDLSLVIAGSGADLGFLRRVAARLGIASRVVFTGAVDDGALLALYRGATAFVLPSAQEGFGIVFLEAMYFGVPVIAAAEKGALDVVQDGVTGLLVPFGDVVALAAAVQRLSADAALHARLVAGGRLQVTGQGPFTHAAFRARVAELAPCWVRPGATVPPAPVSQG